MIVVRQTISPISTFSQAIVRFYGTIGASKRIIEVLNIKNKLKNKGEKILNHYGTKHKVKIKSCGLNFSILTQPQ